MRGSEMSDGVVAVSGWKEAKKSLWVGCRRRWVG
jgi:hypothetical protein